MRSCARSAVVYFDRRNDHGRVEFFREHGEEEKGARMSSRARPRPQAVRAAGEGPLSGQPGKYMLAVRFTPYDPKRKYAFLDPVWFLTVDGKAKDSCPERPR